MKKFQIKLMKTKTLQVLKTDTVKAENVERARITAEVRFGVKAGQFCGAQAL